MISVKEVFESCVTKTVALGNTLLTAYSILPTNKSTTLWTVPFNGNSNKVSARVEGRVPTFYVYTSTASYDGSVLIDTHEVSFRLGQIILPYKGISNIIEILPQIDVNLSQDFKQTLQEKILKDGELNTAFCERYSLPTPVGSVTLKKPTFFDIEVGYMPIRGYAETFKGFSEGLAIDTGVTGVLEDSCFTWVSLDEVRSIESTSETYLLDFRYTLKEDVLSSWLFTLLSSPTLYPFFNGTPSEYSVHFHIYSPYIISKPYAAPVKILEPTKQVNSKLLKKVYFEVGKSYLNSFPDTFTITILNKETDAIISKENSESSPASFQKVSELSVDNSSYQMVYSLPDKITQELTSIGQYTISVEVTNN